MGLKRVAVIGAGSSGLAQTKQLIDAFGRPNVEDELEVVVFESKEEVGGVWYSDEKAKAYLTSSSQNSEGGSSAGSSKPSQFYVYPPDHEDPSPMYEGLHTNLPCDLMAFRDFEFSDDTPTFPDRRTVQEYLEDYATFFDLRRHIRFKHSVTRLHLTPTTNGVTPSSPTLIPATAAASEHRRWTVEFRNAGGQQDKEEFDFVCVANGHYADGWIPPIPGLESWKGTLLHSRFFRRASDFKGQRVLVVGSFASGGDISRLIAGLNVGKYTPEGQPLPTASAQTNGNVAPNGNPHGFTRVYVSSSGPSLHSVDPNDQSSPWAPYVHFVPLISHLSPSIPTSPNGIIHLQDGTTLKNVDVILFATGYNYTYPFCKVSDSRWSTTRLLDGQIDAVERIGGVESDIGGFKGHGMASLDPLLLFLEGDRTICFPALQYQLVPFPMAETQARLVAFLWAGLLPQFPDRPVLPPNPSNPYSLPSANGTAPPATETSPKGGEGGKKPPRKVLQMRKALVFGAPYEWTYQDYLMELMMEAYHSEDDIPEAWKRVEDWRRDRRADTGLRKKVLGY